MNNTFSSERGNPRSSTHIQTQPRRDLPRKNLASFRMHSQSFFGVQPDHNAHLPIALRPGVLY